MYSMKQTCALVDLPYETLKFYCNEGLVPNVKRDAQNYRVFDDRDIGLLDDAPEKQSEQAADDGEDMESAKVAGENGAGTEHVA